MSFEELEKPESTNYQAVLVYGTVNGPNGEVREVHEGETAHMWSIYGRLPDGTSQWIGDMHHQVHAWYFAAHLAQTLGVPVERFSLNVGPLEAAVFMMNGKGTIQ